jgi:hypothetical protein
MNPSAITGFNPNGSVNLTSPLSPHYLGDEVVEPMAPCSAHCEVPEPININVTGEAIGILVFGTVAIAVILLFALRDGFIK